MSKHFNLCQSNSILYIIQEAPAVSQRDLVQDDSQSEFGEMAANSLHVTQTDLHENPDLEYENSENELDFNDVSDGHSESSQNHGSVQSDHAENDMNIQNSQVFVEYWLLF